MAKRKREIRVSGISDRTLEEVQNIANYYELDASAFLRPKIRKIVDSYPPHIRNYKKE